MYKITPEIYAKLFKEIGEDEKTKFVWKLFTSKPQENYIIIKTMDKDCESKIFEIEGANQIDKDAKKKEIMQIGSIKTMALLELLKSRCDFSNARYQFNHLDIEKLSSLFYEWWAFSRASEEELDVFL